MASFPRLPSLSHTTTPWLPWANVSLPFLWGERPKGATLASSSSPATVYPSPAIWMLCKASAAPSLQGTTWFLLFHFPVRWSHPLSWLVSQLLTLAHSFGCNLINHWGWMAFSLWSPNGREGKSYVEASSSPWQSLWLQGQTAHFPVASQERKGAKKATVKQLLTRKSILSSAAL